MEFSGFPVEPVPALVSGYRAVSVMALMTEQPVDCGLINDRIILSGSGCCPSLDFHDNCNIGSIAERPVHMGVQIRKYFLRFGISSEQPPVFLHVSPGSERIQDYLSGSGPG